MSQGPSFEESTSAYGYRPALYVCVIHIALFSTTFGIHLHQINSSRYRFFGPTILLTALLEIVGWIGRLWSNQNLFLETPFVLQVCCLIIGPAPLLVANFIIFGRLVSLSPGTLYSRLHPNHYTHSFVGCNILSLLLQGVGGGVASTAGRGTAALEAGTNLMITGTALQVALMSMFLVLLVEYTLRCIHNKPLKRESSYSGVERFPMEAPRKRLLLAITSTTTLLFIRGIYRLIELGSGWDSTIMQTGWVFSIFDASMVLAALNIWNSAHPSELLEVGQPSAPTDGRMASRPASESVMREGEA